LFFGSGYDFYNAPTCALTDLIVARLREEMTRCVVQTSSQTGTVLPGLAVAFVRDRHVVADF
jgi:hypothetical protein